MKHTRKLEPTDRQIIDEQAALDRPESGTFPMDDEDETALSRTIELKPGDLNDTRSLEELAELASGSYKTEAATMDQHDLSSRPGRSNERKK